MKKLTLESLEVTSFQTSPAAPRERGTVQAHSAPGGPIRLDTYHIDDCGDTQYFHCTYGCSMRSACPNGCIEL